MIFVTVGTTMPFDALLEEVDRLAGLGSLGEPVLCQGGQSTYQLCHGEQFVARPSVVDLMARSSLVITHGGATVVQLLMMKVPFVAFPNPRAAGDHQAAFLTRIARLATISWSRDVGEMARLIAQRRQLGPAQVNSGIPRAGSLVDEAIALRQPRPTSSTAPRDGT